MAGARRHGRVITNTITAYACITLGTPKAGTTWAVVTTQSMATTTHERDNNGDHASNDGGDAGGGDHHDGH